MGGQVSQSNMNPLTYYGLSGPMTDPGECATLFDGLPTEIPELVEVVQGLSLHLHWAERYGVTLSGERKEEAGRHGAEGRFEFETNRYAVGCRPCQCSLILKGATVFKPFEGCLMQ